MKFIFTVDDDGNAKQIGATNENYETVEQETFPAREYREGYKSVLKYDVENGVHWEYIPIPPSGLRERAYETEHSIEYDGEYLTVDQANKLWEVYSAENSSRAEELTVLIAAAKSEIRERYPDIQPNDYGETDEPIGADEPVGDGEQIDIETRKENN